jgi:hypothetical protein
MASAIPALIDARIHGVMVVTGTGTSSNGPGARGLYIIYLFVRGRC